MEKLEALTKEIEELFSGKKPGSRKLMSPAELQDIALRAFKAGFTCKDNTFPVTGQVKIQVLSTAFRPGYPRARFLVIADALSKMGFDLGELELPEYPDDLERPACILWSVVNSSGTEVKKAKILEQRDIDADPLGIAKKDAPGGVSGLGVQTIFAVRNPDGFSASVSKGVAV